MGRKRLAKKAKTERQATHRQIRLSPAAHDELMRVKRQIGDHRFTVDSWSREPGTESNRTAISGERERIAELQKKAGRIVLRHL